ncbi:MAG: glucokinase [Thiobacillus sp.]
MEWIAGDIGGTKCRLAWVTGEAEDLQQLRFECEYASSAFATADDLIRQFITDARLRFPPNGLLLALPGPMQTQHTALTNLDWVLDAADMRATLDIPSVRFINDFQAAAAGVATLGAADVVALNPQPVEPGGVRAITGAGTGLGLAFMLDDGRGRYRHCASEGGHIDFAPANEQQSRLLEALRATHAHVSWERVASGLAMDALYRFCCAEQNTALPDAPVDGAGLVVRAGSGDPAALAALDLFIDLYGAWVGNVALLVQPRGGLYVAGGVAAHLQARMQSPRFMAAATDKGRMRSVVERTPIFLVTDRRLGVMGAIAAAFAPP